MGMGSAKRSIMTLYSGSQDIDSHRIRIVLAEKGILVDVIEVDRREHKEDFRSLSPYNTLPILVDRDLVLYESHIIMEYLDERFPHPPLLPVYPVARAKARLMMHRIEKEWYPLVSTIQQGDLKTAEAARKKLTAGFLDIVPLLEHTSFFFGEEFSLVDCSIIPILWRLSVLAVNLSKKQFQPLLSYQERVFSRDPVQVSLTDTEREMRDE